jgi:hypothetical protein
MNNFVDAAHVLLQRLSIGLIQRIIPNPKGVCQRRRVKFIDAGTNDFICNKKTPFN